MNNKIIEYLHKKGYNPYIGFYATINNWTNWWKNEVEDFHKYQVTYDNRKYNMRMYSLGMAKRISEDWASICWTEKDQITSTEQNKKYLENKLAEIKLNRYLSCAIEKSSYSGTCGAILRIKGAKLIDGQIVANKFTRYDLILMDANQIVPLRVENGKIIDCAFVSETRIQNKKAFYIEIHELVKRKAEDGEIYQTYRIRNIFIDEDGKEIEKENVIKEYYTNSDIALFSILEPPSENPFEEANGLGFSVFGNAIDQLKAVDIAYNNFVMDYYLGGKKIFYNKKLCQMDDKGNVIYPTDLQKQQFQIVGDEMENANEDSLIHEYNPDLRISENKEGLQFFLDLLSFKCGLGSKYYEFNTSGGIVTATQIMMERNDLINNAKKYRDNVDEFVINICRGILLLGRLIFKENVNENGNIQVVNEDGILVSTETLKEEYLNEISAGIRSVEEYRMKFFGETEEEAKEKIAKANNTDISFEESGN
jgi:A118 family predicted phage portal protein